MADTDNTTYLSTAKAAQYLGISPATLYRMVARGILTPTKTPGGQRRFNVQELDRYLSQSKDIEAPQNPYYEHHAESAPCPEQMSFLESTQGTLHCGFAKKNDVTPKRKQNGDIAIERIWAMPNSHTFEIKPIHDLIESELTDGLWIDPFANRNKFASITNDLSTEYDTDYHMDALEFLQMFDDESVDGVLYDPPYSPRQVSECYNNVGLNVTWDTTKASFWGNHKREISRIVKAGGKVITFGWNSGGIGYKYGFEIVRILLVPHGGWHNDTICTVEVKTHEGEKKEMSAPTKQTSCAPNSDQKGNERDERLVVMLKQLPPNYWDFASEDTHEYTHGLHNYPAMMVAPISKNIMRIVRSIMPINSVFDPFSGSGTVLVEAMLAGMRQIYGNDINPLALLLCSVKTNLIQEKQLREETDSLKSRINERIAKSGSFFASADDYMENTLRLDLTSKDGWGSEAASYLQEYCKAKNVDFAIPDFKNIGYWFKPNVILQLQMIKEEILRIIDKKVRDFVFVAMSETIRYVSNRRNGEFKMFRMPAAKVATFNPNVIDDFLRILDRNVSKMIDFVEATSQYPNGSNVTIANNDAGTLADVPDDCADLVITSPPYGDSRTTVAYGEYSRLSLQWLGLDNLSERQIMGIDKSLMGGKKYRNGFDFQLPSATLRASLERIKDVDLERAGDVFSFYDDLARSIQAVARKTKKGGYQFWVVGNRTVKNELLQTDVIISEIAESYGMQHVYTVDRNIPNKVMPSLNSPSNVSGAKGSTMTMEHIVVLRKA